MFNFLRNSAQQFLIVGTVLLLASTGASAHTGLKESVPAAKSTHATLPEAIVLHFSGPVRLVGLTLSDANGDRAAMSVTPASAAEARYELPMPSLTCGDWTLRWIAMGADGHKMSGNIPFFYLCESAAE
ncbi:copper resistance CopC family protein [Simiduia aestuariiviva]|uniref:CopC domain-containing protein n=1 Tax=Simiduia aestuariiviva TaxID=1510459 RepID=A0A839UIR0_9GAMM|nr:copper resistance CopC family protein [Simiduia aestuariiviva]MBB3167423.1 hypothetical protein [Simiduia aestuariiviva]